MTTKNQYENKTLPVVLRRCDDNLLDLQEYILPLSLEVGSGVESLTSVFGNGPALSPQRGMKALIKGPNTWLNVPLSSGSP